MSVNKVILVGRLGKDPEVKMTADQKQIVNFSLATSEKVKGQQQTEWHRVVCFGKLAELASSYLGKGREIYLEGKIKTNKWQDKDGNNRYSTDILASSITFLVNKNDQPEGVNFEQVKQETLNTPNSQTTANTVDFEDSDIPF